MVGVGTKGRLLLGEGPVKVSFLFSGGRNQCDTGVALATHMSHTVPENCRERGYRW